jgi:peptide/histidine transporter 3/4
VSSKAALLILLWNLILVAGFESLLDPNFFRVVFETDDDFSTTISLSVILYSVVAFLFLFYPLAGCLADIRWGRYKTVVYSVRVIWGSLVAMAVLGSVASMSILIPSVILELPDLDNYPNTIQLTVIILVGVVFGIPTLIAFLLIPCGLICFSANVIQYGMDQLHDAPMEDSILYIHWYVWTSYAGLLPLEIGFNIDRTTVSAFSPCLMLLPLLLLGVTLCIQRYKRQWFLTDTGSKNPYKLVYRVLKFAKDHTNPIHRSAFTYCEDELPSRLDLGKEKYGGPFTTEQVEDVKAFLGILRVLISLAPIMMADFSIDGILGIFASHLDGKLFKNLIYYYDNQHAYGFQVDTLTPLMITFLIPIYLCLLRPFIQNYIPGMLKRIGLGMIFILLSILCTSVMGQDAYGHIVHTNVTACFLHYESDLFFDYYFRHVQMSLDISSYWLVIQYSLNAVGYMLLYIAVYEFICSQSPHAMKGLVIGTFFAIKGVFQLLGVVVIYLPFALGWKNILRSFPSCGFVYYLINAIIALIGIVAYTCVARRYQYRERDEPDNIYRYAEEYYANAQDEPNYDYDDYDNLDVHTINNN